MKLKSLSDMCKTFKIKCHDFIVFFDNVKDFKRLIIEEFESIINNIFNDIKIETIHIKNVQCYFYKIVINFRYIKIFKFQFGFEIVKFRFFIIFSFIFSFFIIRVKKVINK